MSDSWYTYGSDYVVVRTGMPEHAVELGIGATYEEAVESLYATPIQSTGPDSGERAALRWAVGAGWIDSLDDLVEDDGPDEDEDDDEDPA